MQFEAQLAEGAPHELSPLMIPPQPPGVPTDGLPSVVRVAAENTNELAQRVASALLRQHARGQACADGKGWSGCLSAHPAAFVAHSTLRVSGFLLASSCQAPAQIYALTPSTSALSGCELDSLQTLSTRPALQEAGTQPVMHPGCKGSCKPSAIHRPVTAAITGLAMTFRIARRWPLLCWRGSLRGVTSCYCRQSRRVAARVRLTT